MEVDNPMNQIQIHCGLIDVFDQAFIHSTYIISYIYYTMPSEVLRNNILEKWNQSDVDPKRFKRIINISQISQFQPYQ